MHLKTLNLRDIHPYERNPRINDKAVEPVMKSIQKDGYRARIIVDKDGVIIAGHTRYEAMKRLGWTEAEVWIADDMTPEQIADYRIRDNLTADFAEWDFSELEAEITEMGLDFDMSDFGFDDISSVTDDDLQQDEKTDFKYFADKEIEQAIIDDWQRYADARAFALNVIDRASAMHQFNRLCQGYNDGYNISALFNPHRFDTSTKKSESILKGWNDDDNYRKQFARYIVEVAGRVPPKNEYYKLIVIGTGGYQYVNEFQPYLARDIYRQFVHDGDKVLNPCAGWGGRLLGFAACMFDNAEYVETDPAKETYQGLLQLKDFLRLGDNIKQYNLPFEDLHVEADYFDFVFTSPPYFDTERYSEDEGQSYLRYNSFEAWVDSFLVPMLDKILYCMKSGGKCLLNVGNVIYDIDTAIEKHLDALGVKYTRLSDFKIGGNGIGARTGEGGEPFILFKKE